MQGKPTRNTDAQYECVVRSVEYTKAGVTSTQPAEIANELVWNAIHVEETGDRLLVRLIDSPEYSYRLSDFRRV